MKIWIYLEGRQQGPFQLEELKDLPVTEETKVWFAGLPKWYPAGVIPELKSYVRRAGAKEGSDAADTDNVAEEGEAIREVWDDAEEAESEKAEKPTVIIDAVLKNAADAGDAQKTEEPAETEVPEAAERAEMAQGADEACSHNGNAESYGSQESGFIPAPPPFTQNTGEGMFYPGMNVEGPQMPLPFAGNCPYEGPAMYPTGNESEGAPLEGCPPNRLIWAILSTVILCSPISLIGIFTAVKVNSAWRDGNYPEAKKYSDLTGWLIIVSWALGWLPGLMLMAML